MTRASIHKSSILLSQHVALMNHVNRLRQCANMSSRAYSSELLPYAAPTWAARLRGIPTHRIQLAQLPTPIHRWRLPGLNHNFQISIKRDDMTGNTLSGNKVRKLEFLLADAVSRGCKHVMTCGGIQSNHCRATAVAALQLGLQSHLLLRADLNDTSEVGCSGNLFLNRLCGAHMYFVPKLSKYELHLKPRMQKLAEKIKKNSGEESYVIPVGGSNEVGMFGYLTGFEELLSQDVQKDFDDIVFACGSGGTAAGLAIANYLSGANLRIHALSVSDDAAYFHGHLNEVLTTTGLDDVKSEDILDVIDGYKGQGYGVSTKEELEFITRVSCQSSILLDPVYTGKAVRGMIQELNTNPQRFKGNRILYIHTGGIFGMYDGRLDEVILNSAAATNRVKMWKNTDEEPS